MSYDGPPRWMRYQPARGRNEGSNRSGTFRTRADALNHFLASDPRPYAAVCLPTAVLKMCPILACDAIQELKEPLAPVTIIVGPCGSGKTIGIPALLAGRLSAFKGLMMQRTRLAVKKSFEQQTKLEKDYFSNYPVISTRILDDADESYLGMYRLGFDTRECRADCRTVNSRLIVAVTMGLGDRVAEQACTARSDNWVLHASERETITFKNPPFYHQGPAMAAIKHYDNFLAVYHKIDMVPDHPEAICTIIPPELFVAVGNAGQDLNNERTVRTTTIGGFATNLAGKWEDEMLNIRNGADAAFADACRNGRLRHSYTVQSEVPTWLRGAVKCYDEFARQMDIEGKGSLLFD